MVQASGGPQSVSGDSARENKIFQARIEKIHRSGALVRLSATGPQAWVPAREIEPELGHDGDLLECEALQVGQELPVVIYGQADYQGRRERLASHIRAVKDPWDGVRLWSNDDVKTMEVDLVTGERALGVIAPGIRGQVVLETLANAFPPAWQEFVKLRPGDKVAGFVSKEEIDHQRRIVTLDVAKFAKSKISVETVLSPGLTAGNQRVIASEVPRDGGAVGRPNLNHPLRRLLVVDNDRELGNNIREHLIGYGCQEVLLAISEVEAKQLLDSQREPLDLAIIDIHLHEGTNDFLGLRVAAHINSDWSNVPVVLTTGHEKIYNLGSIPNSDVQVCDLILKPLTPDEILRALAAAGNKSRPLQSILNKEKVQVQKRSRSPHSADWHQQITETLGEIAGEIGAESAVLFSVHPVSMKVCIVARYDPSNRVPYVKKNIERSPIQDVALEEEELLTADASDRRDFPKHRWLQLAYKYRSCIGVRVPVASELAYGLFAFHTLPDIFASWTLLRLKQVARQIGSMLFAERTQKRLADVEPYELLGRSYGSMAHDLRGAVSTLATNKLLELTRGQDSVGGQKLQEIRERIQSLHASLSQAAAIVHTFTRVARGAQEQEQDVVLLDLVQPYVKSLAEQEGVIRPEVVVSADFAPRCRVRVRPTGLKQVLFNLVLNAVQQIERFPLRDRRTGEVVVELAQETRGKSPYACIRVHDTGPGIHGGDFARVFEDGFTTKENGLGMGLDICRRMAETKGPKGQESAVTIQHSILFTGTTFEVSLPVHG